MNRLRPFYELTELLESLLEQEITSVNRDTIIGEVNRLIEQRAILFMEIYPPFTEEEKRTGAQIVEKNRVLQSKLNLLFSNLKQEMKQIQQKKKSNLTYINPYGHIRPADGMFLDSKK